MSACRLVIFDFDGTLADSRQWFMNTLNDVADSHGFRKVSESEMNMLRSRPTREIVRYLGIRVWQMPAIARDLRRRSAEAASEIQLFEGVPELLSELRRSGVAIAIVSSNAEATVRTVLGDAAALVDHFVCGVSLFGKAARFRGLRRRLQLGPHQILAVGDEGRDVEAAKRVGFASVAVTWGYATEAALRSCSPTLIVRSVAELAGLRCAVR